MRIYVSPTDVLVILSYVQHSVLLYVVEIHGYKHETTLLNDVTHIKFYQ